MCGQLVPENYKLKRCIRCKACDLSKNASCALLCFKPLKLPKFLFQQKGYNKIAKFNKQRLRKLRSFL